MQNHRTFYRRIRLLLQPMSQRRRIVAIPGATVTQLTDMVSLKCVILSIVFYKGEGVQCMLLTIMTYHYCICM